MIRQRKVKAIKIMTVVKEGMRIYVARITTDENKVRHLAIVDPDTFVFNLDSALEEYAGMYAGDGAKIEVK